MQREKLRPAELPAIPGFELVRRLGRGGMGEVFEAVRLGSGGFRKPVALKTLNPGIEPKSLERFLHECRITAQLEHPNIVRVYDLLTLAQRHFLVMELLRGRVLSALQETKGGTDWFALSVADQVLDGLSYAHEFCDEQGLPLGLVHRDLTPRNLFVCDSGTVKILDFGLARMKNAAALALTQEGMVAGTPAYLSPEQANGLAVDVRTDVYQLGATIYDLLTGHPPHGDGYLHEQLAHARSGRFTPIRELRPEVPAGVAALVEKALSASPDDRFPSARAMREAVQLELDNCPTRGPSALARMVAAVPSSLPPPAPRRRLDGRANTAPEFMALGGESAIPTSPAEDAITAAGTAPDTSSVTQAMPAPASSVQANDIHSGEHALPRPNRDSRVGDKTPFPRAGRNTPSQTPFPRGPEAGNRPTREVRPPSSTEISLTVPAVPSLPFETDREPSMELGMEPELPTAPDNLRPEDDALEEQSLELPKGALVAGRYRIERFVAQGGMGAVYEAEDLELKETVALKTIRPELAGDERAVERFKREIHLARRVTHPNVCRIFDIGFHSEQSGRVSSPGAGRIIFLTMELVQGETLAERLRRVGRLTTDEALIALILWTPSPQSVLLEEKQNPQWDTRPLGTDIAFDDEEDI